MASVNPIIIQTGINAGTPFGLNHLVKVTNPGPPAELSSIPAEGLLDGAVQYISIPDSAGNYSTIVGAVETIRIQGGMIVSGAGTDSVAIGRGAAAAIASGGNGADTIAIGRGVIGGTVTTQRIAIGATANISGGASVVLGFNSGSGSANPVGGVFIGSVTQASGAGAGANVVVIGDGALITLGAAGGGGGVAIGFAASIAHPSGVAIGYSAQATLLSALGQNTVTIGDSATSNKAGTTVVGGASVITGTNGIIIGSGSSNAGTDTILIGRGGALTNSQQIAIGSGALNIGANVLQLGAPSTDIQTLVMGAGDTIASPAARTIRFTNATGTNNAAGAVTLIAPLSTGNVVPSGFIFQTGVAHASDAVLQTPATAAQLDGTATATFTRLLLYTVDTGTVQRVQTITNASILTLLGLGAGRLLFVPA